MAAQETYYHEILEFLLRDLRGLLNEPQASDWSKDFMIKHLIKRYEFYLENPARIADASRIEAMSKGKME